MTFLLLFILKLDNAREKNYYEHILKNVCSQNKMELLLMNIFEKCPILENEKFFIRLFQMDDCDDLLNVYSDKNELPFFNSDGCDGDNFYYATKERMSEALGFWKMAYENGWFVRLSIVDKGISRVIGTVELCFRVSEDAFNNMGIIRVDVRSDYEKEDVLYSIFSLCIPESKKMLGCNGIVTKVPIYAIERMKAIQAIGFTKSEHLLIGKTGYAYDGYWII